MFFKKKKKKKKKKMKLHFFEKKRKKKKKEKEKVNINSMGSLSTRETPIEFKLSLNTKGRSSPGSGRI